METYTVYLRYYPGDPLVDIRAEDLDEMGKAFSVKISFKRIENRVLSDGMLREETMDKPIEEITQDVITVSTESEGQFRKAIAAVYEKYRSPRTTYGFWGSGPAARRIARQLVDETGGGW